VAIARGKTERSHFILAYQNGLDARASGSRVKKEIGSWNNNQMQQITEPRRHPSANREREEKLDNLAQNRTE
jgi:hypothetical protein